MCFTVAERGWLAGPATSEPVCWHVFTTLVHGHGASEADLGSGVDSCAGDQPTWPPQTYPRLPSPHHPPPTQHGPDQPGPQPTCESHISLYHFETWVRVWVRIFNWSSFNNCFLHLQMSGTTLYSYPSSFPFRKITSKNWKKRSRPSCQRIQAPLEALELWGIVTRRTGRRRLPLPWPWVTVQQQTWRSGIRLSCWSESPPHSPLSGDIDPTR